MEGEMPSLLESSPNMRKQTRTVSNLPVSGLRCFALADSATARRKSSQVSRSRQMNVQLLHQVVKTLATKTPAQNHEVVGCLLLPGQGNGAHTSLASRTELGASK